jgi:carbon storage regulator
MLAVRIDGRSAGFTYSVSRRAVVLVHFERINRMLVLTVKEGHAVSIGDDIQVKIVSIDGSRIRIGIEAPKEIGIRRDRDDDRERAA